MNDKSLLNYPGSKKRLLDFIFNNSKQYIRKEKYILDIFSGTGCVSQMFKSKGYKVFANDVEIYASNISSTLLKNNHKIDFDSLEKNYEYNKNQLINLYGDQIKKEEELIKSSSKDLISFNESLLKVWQLNFKIVINDNIITSIDDLNKHKYDMPFMLFTLYYSGVYFGLEQSIEIDSIRYAIEKEEEKDVLLTSLYYAIKEVSFSKDGHMAQPLNQNKNFKKLIDVRSKKIYEIFKSKLQEFSKINDNTFVGKSFNLPFDKLINLDEIKNNVGFIYADPPYTDMQYSRYFHLLTTISNYEYPYMTYKQGKITTGLYAENRFQSNISSKSKSLTELKKLMSFSSENKINLCFSYAYPVDLEKQASNRYTMNISDLIYAMKSYFDDVIVVKEFYSHCNNRNSQQKKVFEYLIIGIFNNKIKQNDSKINDFKDGKLVLCMLSVNGIDILDMKICFYIKDEKILYINGDFLFGKPVEEYSAALIDGINILYNITNESDETINILSQNLAYSVFDIENGSKYIVPCWIISYASSKNNPSNVDYMIFNALTGESLG